jgi:hypothetical protein
MGKSFTPTYRIEITDDKGEHRYAWSVASYGKPTASNLKIYIQKYIESLKCPKGANCHVSKSLGYILEPNKARIVRQKGGQVVAKWEAEKFMTI